MRFKQWVFVLGLLVSLKPLSQLLPLLAPWLCQEWSVVSQVGQGQQETPGQADTSNAAPRPGNTAPQSGETAPQSEATAPAAPDSQEPVHPFQWQSTPNDRLGALVNSELVVQIVEPLSPAEEAGLNGGDKLLAVNGKPLHSLSELQAVLSHRPASVVLTIKPFVREQEQEQQDVTVTLPSEPTSRL